MLPNNVMEERKKQLEQGRKDYILNALAANIASQVKAANVNSDWYKVRDFIYAQLKK